MDENTFEDTLQCIIDHYEVINEQKDAEIMKLKQENSDLSGKLAKIEEEKLKRRQKEYYRLKTNESGTTFIKLYPEGMKRLITLEKQKKITDSDIANFTKLSMFLDIDTGRLTDNTGKYITKAKIASEIGKRPGW